MVDVTYVDAAGHAYKDVRVIGYGSSNGNQDFLFDVAHMIPATPEAVSITAQPSSQIVTVGQSTRFTVAANGTPPPAYQWQVSTDGGSTWTDLTERGALQRREHGGAPDHELHHEPERLSVPGSGHQYSRLGA